MSIANLTLTKYSVTMINNFIILYFTEQSQKKEGYPVSRWRYDFGDFDSHYCLAGQLNQYFTHF